MLAIAFAATLASCTSIAIPPAPTNDDVEVFLVDEGWHKGLVLREADGERVEWGFGDWAWYALEKNRWYDVFATVLWPTTGTLSRRAWTDGEEARRAHGDVSSFRAPRERVEALARSLEARFARAPGNRVWNASSSTSFARDPDRYWLLHDCHDATARWLEALGCEVEPALVRAGLRVRELPTAQD